MITRIIKIAISLCTLLLIKLKDFFYILIHFHQRPKCTAIYYHSIFDDEISNFERQIKYLSGKTKVFKSDYSDNIKAWKLCTIVTFDDGYENVYRNAVPVLKKYNLPFTIFFISNYFEKIPDWEIPLNHRDKNQRIMSVEQMNSIPSELLTIGSHTANHKKLTTLPPDDLLDELKESKARLEALANREVNVIAFPNGIFDSNVITESLKAGYNRLYTIEPVYALKEPNEIITGRFPVNGNDWFLEFWLKVNGAYTWMNWIK